MKAVGVILLALLCASHGVDATTRVRKLQTHLTEHVKGAHPLDFWRELGTFRPPASSYRRTWQDFAVAPHAVTDGRGDVNTDYYYLTITQLPSGFSTMLELFQAVRANLLEGESTWVVDPNESTFVPMDDSDGTKWASSNPVGTMVNINMKVLGQNADDGTVVCSKYRASENAAYWIFSTVYTMSDSNHPVSGNREFGFKKEGANWIFYTKGFDRVTTFVESMGNFFGNQVWSGADRLWRSLIRNVVAHINNNGGRASAGTPDISRRNFQTVWSSWTEHCYEHSGHKYAIGSGSCKCTNWVETCSGDGECAPDEDDPCQDTCRCGFNNANECRCTRSVAHGKVCDPWFVEELMETSAKVTPRPARHHAAKQQ